MRMSVLSLETAGPEPAVAVLANGRLFEEKLPAGGRASEELLPAATRALAAAGESLATCERIAACSGPGSFTGVRVGLATAWGLGRALGIPVEAVSTLEVLADAARVAGEEPGAGPDRMAAFLDAGRGELVGALVECRNGRGRLLAPPARVAVADATRLAAGAPMVSFPAGLLAPAASLPLARSLAAALALAVARFPRDEATSLSAVYSRPSAAEEKFGAP